MTPPEPRRIFLAIFGTQRRPRVVPPSKQKFARAYARRWWLVEAADAATARSIIVTACRIVARPHDAYEQWRAAAARIIDCGRNGPGGPTHLPRNPQTAAGASVFQTAARPSRSGAAPSRGPGTRSAEARPGAARSWRV